MRTRNSEHFAVQNEYIYLLQGSPRLPSSLVMLTQRKPKIIKGLFKGLPASRALGHCEAGRTDAAEPDKAVAGEAINSPIKRRG